MLEHRLYSAADLADFSPSVFGYLVEPDGTIVAIDDSIDFEKIVAERNLEFRNFYEDLSDEERNSVSKSLFEDKYVEEMGYIRVAVHGPSAIWNVASSRATPTTPEQMESLDALVRETGQNLNSANVWHGRGYGPWVIVRRWISSLNWGQ